MAFPEKSPTDPPSAAGRWLRIFAGVTLCGYAAMGILGELFPALPFRDGTGNGHALVWVIGYGAFFISAAAVALSGRGATAQAILMATSVAMIWIWFCKWFALSRGIALWFEHASQVATPLLLALLLGSKGEWNARLDLVARVAIAATFIFHGLFAFGLPSGVWFLNFSTPSSFVEMSRACLPLPDDGAALSFLRIAGIIDFVVAAWVLLPLPRQIPLVYMTLWGFLTALARPVSYYDSSAAMETLLRWVPEFLYRFPHGALPLLLLLIYTKRGRETELVLAS